MERGPVLDALLDLNGSILDQGDGYWIKFEVRRVESSPQIPHGIRYSLSLHEPFGKRILGYDNAHGVKQGKSGRYKGRILAYDHKHRHMSDKGIPYAFQDAQQLISDFFDDVDKALEEIKQR